MVNLSLKTMVIKKLMLCAFLPLFILSALWNSYYSIISFIATNLSVRESFYFANDVNNKGTHWGGDKYRLTTRQHKLTEYLEQNNNRLPKKESVVYIEGRKGDGTVFLDKVSIYDDKIYMKLSDLK